MEIYRFLPPPLLEHFDAETMDIEEFLHYVAKARFIEQLESDLIAKAISEVFSD